jgi:uncharacterized membrane protein
VSQSGVVSTNDPAQAGTAKAIYILYLVGLVTGPFVPIICVIFALINREIAPAWLESHYEVQVRTFWIGLLFFFVSLATVLIYIGWLLGLLTLIWWTVRCVKGLIALFDGRPYENPETWLW